MGVIKVTINQENAGQRIDNYLLTACKGVPKTRLYRAIRKGEVRVNQKRARPDYRLVSGDIVRIPPMRAPEPKAEPTVPRHLIQQIEQGILVETDDYLIINKPSGIPVHGGTGIKTGLIEALRVLRPKSKRMELVHRLDRDTSGALLVAKKRSILVMLHQMLVHKKVSKRYLALVRGSWSGGERRVTAPLRKNQLAGGERMVVVDEEGKPSETVFRPLIRFDGATLVEASPVTGRTHQIRVHAAHINHPIAGDEKYGNKLFNRKMKEIGLSQLFLHSASLYCELPLDPPQVVGVCAPMDKKLRNCLQNIPQLTD